MLFLGIILMSTFGNSPLHAQDYLANIQFYNQENGLAGQYANCTFRDSRGLIWIGTQFGLHRFDGRDFLIFNEATGLPFPQVMQIHEDSEGWLWLFRNCFGKMSCTRDLSFFHSITHEVQTFEERFGPNINFSAEDIISSVSTEDGTIFLGLNNKIIHWKEGAIAQTIELNPFDTDIRLLAALPSKALAFWYNHQNDQGEYTTRYAAIDLEGNFQIDEHISNTWASGPKQFFHYLGRDFLGRQMVVWEAKKNADRILSVLMPNGQLVEDSLNFAGSNKFYKITPNPYRLEAWLDFKVFAPGGLELYDFKEHFPVFRNKDLALRQTRFDEQDIAWVSSRYGVFRIQLKTNPFKRILYQRTDVLGSISQNISRCILPLDKDRLIFFMYQGIFEKKPNIEKLIKHPGNASFSPNALFNVIKGANDFYWGGYGGKLLKMQINDQIEIQEVKQLFSNKFHRIFTQYFQGDRLWMGTNEGLHYFETKTDEFGYVNYNEFEELKNQHIHHIYEESKERIWLCTTSGLYLFNPEKGIQERFWQEGQGVYKIPATNFYRIKPAQQGGWWLASGNGLIHWDSKKSSIQQFNVENGLKTNEILGFHEDEFGFLWLATNTGLIQFETRTGNFKVWLEEDGVSSQDFEPYLYHCQSDGTVWFGTTNGYVSFHPKDFKNFNLNKRPNIPLNILQFEQFSDETKKMEDKTAILLEQQKITLQPGEQIFHLKIALADYVNGEDAKYSFRIKGFQDFWQEGKESLIRISGLPYGEFTLEIKGRLASGQFSSKEIHLPIIVVKPFYLQTWFIITILFILVSSVFFWNKWRLQQLKNRQLLLQRMVEEQTETITQQAEELKQLDKAKSRFFANISHELRTPLTLILGPVGTILKNNILELKYTKLLKLAQESGHSLLTLINELLDLSKLESNKLELSEEPTILYLFARRLVSSFESFAESKKIDFLFQYEGSSDLQIFIDNEKFQKIVNNLLSNAFKFTPEGGKITFQLQDQNHCILLKVEDTGRGISPEDVPNVFNRFYQTKAPNNAAEGGTGIGLALCKEFAKLFKGKIWVESEIGEGSTFYFEFPKKEVLKSLNTAAAFEIEKLENEGHLLMEAEDDLETEFPNGTSKTTFNPNVITSNQEQKSKILIVEDNSSLRSYLKMILEELYEVHTAENGKIALDILDARLAEQDTNFQKLTKNNFPIELIISDLMMPIMDGFQFLEQLKSSDNWRHIPFVMLTARADLGDRLKALRIGVDDYLTKPFEEEELLVRVANLLKNYKERSAVFQLVTSELESEEEQTINEPFLSKEDQEWLEKLETLTLSHLHDSIFNVEKLAGLLFISRRQLQRKVQQLTGLLPNNYIQEARLHKAKTLLENKTVSSVKAVAFEVGIRNVKYFSKGFKKRFGKLPSTYL